MSTARRTLLVVVLALSGLATTFGYGPWLLYKRHQVAGWDVVRGEVTARDVRRVSGARAGREKYELDLRYRYEHGGASHEGARWSHYGPRTFATRDAAWSAAPAVGSVLDVLVDPLDSASAVLVAPSATKAWAAVGFGAVLMIGAAWAARR